ncbi:glycosyltransferase [Clostridium scatologenes]|uniref:Glycosyltransferase n=1 Tax=Clostridium scatologenes TaxID=1548 RepID=A0A0E3MAA8_CLOSL|nr:glycosyltransferase [Clostridium scatologenes]AKA71907.1 glycosyltransferase [Clostridium scatologenes]
MNIAMVLTNGFDPDPRVYKEAKSLTKLGHKVTILCWDRSGVYINKPEENIDGIKIVRFFGNAQYGSGYKQAFKFLKFKKDVLEYMKNKKFDAIHCHDFDGLFIGHSINKKLKLKLVYDEHDLFYTYFLGRPGLLNKLIYNFIILREKSMLRNVDKHIVVTPKMSEIYKNISKEIYIVNNAPYKNLFNNIKKIPSDKLRIGFIGSVRYYDEMKALVDASQFYKDKVEIVVCGRGIYSDKLADYSKKFSNVRIKGAYSIDELEELYRNVDITYAFYPGNTATISMPNKFYESIITETPIIANIKTEFGYEVQKHKIGYGISGEHLTEELKVIIANLVEDKNEKKNILENMRQIKEDYFWESNEPILNKIYSV